MPLYIPWLTETIKKRGVRYLLHHYLGQFFEEKLTLEQLSIDIYEGKGSIRNLGLDVDGLNDELDFIPFKFLDGCLIGQISVEVPWSSLATEACKVELEGAKFVCRLKTSSDGGKVHCTESTLLSRSLMTSSMQMAEDIVTTEDDDEYESPNTSLYRQSQDTSTDLPTPASSSKRKDANQMFEGLEMFAQLIDSVLRRTKLTARNTLFQIQPHPESNNDADAEEDSNGETSEQNRRSSASECRSTSGDESGTFRSEEEESEYQSSCSSEGTVEFFIKFFRCEEVIEESRTDADDKNSKSTENNDEESSKRPLSAMPETITKLLTLEDVEMRIGGVPVSNLIGKHTIMIKFNGQKSEISVFSGSPLLAVIGHEQLKTFFNVFDSSKYPQDESSPACEINQKVMSAEDYAKIENQLLESANLHLNSHQVHDLSSFVGNLSNRQSISQVSGRKWMDNGEILSSNCRVRQGLVQDLDYHPPNTPSSSSCLDGKGSDITEATLDNIEAFSCELKLPGIWLCILRDGETLPPLIKPYADSINSFQTINKYIEEHIKVAHIRFLALKVALDLTSSGINVFLGDLEISEHLQDNSMNPVLHLLKNDSNSSQPLNTSRYKAHIVNNKDITVELLTKTRILFDPTIIDRIVYDYKLIDIEQTNKKRNLNNQQQDMFQNQHQSISNNQLDLNLTLKGEQFKAELMCPVPDLTPEGLANPCQLRPQSFLFDFKDIILNWDCDKLKVSANELVAYVKTQPQQADSEAVKFIESIGKNNNKIVLTLETSPSNLDSAFPNDIEQTLNESSMYDSIYIGQATESRIPCEAFQTKRKVVRSHIQNKTSSTPHQSSEGVRQETNSKNGGKSGECDNEKIVTPGDRQHLLDYLNQTVTATKLSLTLHLPICEVEFEDKEQLDLIYNRFGNDFVFWQPKAFTKQNIKSTKRHPAGGRKRDSRRQSTVQDPTEHPPPYYGHKNKISPGQFGSDFEEEDEDEKVDDEESEVSFHSLSVDGSHSDYYDNEVTCKIVVDEVFVRFNHQSCAAALKQEIYAENLLMGIVLDINKKPGTVLSLVADNLELSTDTEIVLQGNAFGDKNSIFSLTAEIKRPTSALKDIKLAIQLVNGLFNDFTTDTYTRFWQSINVTDEPITGYVAPKIVTELHVDILETSLSLVRADARPALLTIDELYLTSMVMEQTSQVMIRLIADEVSLYLKRNRQGQEIMKNYICLVDSGLIDLDIKFSHDGRLEFGVINNVITVRVCQDSLSALVKLFNIMIKGSNNNSSTLSGENNNPSGSNPMPDEMHENKPSNITTSPIMDPDGPSGERIDDNSTSSVKNQRLFADEMNLLEDAMNDFSKTSLEVSSKGGDTWSIGSSKENVSGKHLKTNPNLEHDNETSNEDEEEEEDDDDDDDYSSTSSSSDETDSSDDSDRPPVIQKTTGIDKRRRDPNACLLDESNPLIDGLFSQPLLQPVQKQQSLLIQDSKDQLLASSDSSIGLNQRPIDESGFFVIGDDDVGAGIMDKLQHEPVVRKLTDRPINIIENHFKMTKPRTIPEMLALSLERYVLEEMTLVVNLFGGRDFDDYCSSSSSENTKTPPVPTNSSSTTTANDEAASDAPDTASADSGSVRSRSGSVKKSPLSRKHYSSECTVGGSSSLLKKKTSGVGRRKHLSESRGDTQNSRNQSTLEPRVRFGEGAVNLWESLDLMSSPDFFGTRRPSQPPVSSDTKLAGGTWRETDVCIQLTLTKVKLLYELADHNSPISWRFMLFIHDIEIKDRIHASDINKMLYEYCTETMPKRNTQMLTVKNIATINASDGCEECDLRVSLKPLRLNIDQDTLLFLIEFFTSFSKSLAKQQSAYQAPQRPNSSSTTTTTINTSSSRVKSDNTTSGPSSSHTSGASKIGGASVGASSHHQRIRQHSSEQQLEEKQLPAAHKPNKGQSKATNSSGSSFSSSSSGSHSNPASPTSTPSRSTKAAPPVAAAAAVEAHCSSSETNASSSKQTSSNVRRRAQANAASVELVVAHPAQAQTPNAISGPDDKRSAPLPTHCHKDNVSGWSGQQPIYIKSFTFSPDVPIRLDYHAKHLDFEQGALAGILMGLAHLDHSELVLRRVQAKHGMRGLDRVLLFTLNSWISDIKRNQLPSILGGVGPMHSVIQLFQGMRDLIWMPIDHYRKDRRLVRGLQRGASSFSSSTAMAAINLMNRFISIVQCTAQIAHDIVTPPTFHHSSSGGGAGVGLSRGLTHETRYKSTHSVSSQASNSDHHHHHGRRHVGTCKSSCSSSSIAGLNQPRNFCEGVAVGYTILKEGFNDTARNVAVGMQAEDVRSAVGELVRQIPSTLLNPIISATEGAQNVLVGIRNQIAPDARREDQEKWKRRVRGK